MKQFEKYYRTKLEGTYNYPPYECLTAETMATLYNSLAFSFWRFDQSIQFFKAACKRFAEAFPKS